MYYYNTYHMLHLSRRLHCSGKWLNMQHPSSCLMYFALTVNSVGDVLVFYLLSHLDRVLIMLVQAPHSPRVGKVCLRSIPAILVSSTFQSLSAQISCTSVTRPSCWIESLMFAANANSLYRELDDAWKRHV